jgi:hypothetical protein
MLNFNKYVITAKYENAALVCGWLIGLFSYLVFKSHMHTLWTFLLRKFKGVLQKGKSFLIRDSLTSIHSQQAPSHENDCVAAMKLSFSR